MPQLLDKTKPYCLTGIGDRKFWGQDDKHFDMGTLEEVDISKLQPAKPEKTPVLTCNFCGVKRETPELMREHLLALHKADMEKAKPKPEEPKCLYCEAPKKVGVKEGEWQFDCECYMSDLTLVSKAKSDAPVSVESVKKKPAKKPTAKKRKKK